MAAPGLWFGKCCKSGDSNWTEPWNPGSLNNQGKGCNGWSPKWWSPPSMLRIGNALPRILDQVYPNSRYNIFSCTRQMAWHVIAIQYNTPEDWAQHTEVYLIFRKCAHNIYIYTHIQFYIIYTYLIDMPCPHDTSSALKSLARFCTCGLWMKQCGPCSWHSSQQRIHGKSGRYSSHCPHRSPDLGYRE